VSVVGAGLTRGKVLVTGGNGFIGTHVVDRLLGRGFEVGVLDRIGSPHRADVEPILGDVRDRDLIFALARRFDGIVNLAAILGTSETVDHPHGTVASNLVGALHIFDAAREHGCRVAQITVGNHWMNNPYAITKSAAERFAVFYDGRYGTKIAVVRGLNGYGERQKAWPVRKIIPNFVLPALRGEELLVYGDGQQRMDMIYVGDLAEILVRALVLDHGAWGTIFEAGTGDAPTVDEIAEAVLRAVPGTRARVRHVPMRRGEPERSLVVGDPRTLAPLGIAKQTLLGLDEGLARTVRFYAAHAADYA
jgi:UDP-glucose 4-epimerase